MITSSEWCNSNNASIENIGIMLYIIPHANVETM